ncbi:MAG: sigma-E factor regulatory protein RseB domain-containing protein [Bacillota bacterium]|nr:sigma-E factor regulatory protein RseB domain-containing protein [Bacillota bacterium]
MKRVGWLVTGWLLLFGVAGWTGNAGAAIPAPLAEQVLRKALAADGTQTYVGTMVLFTWAVGNGDATVIKVRHRAPGQSRLEYLSSRNEPYLVTVDDGRHRWHYHPGERAASVGPSPDFKANLEQSLGLLRHNYHLQYGGTGEVTGRITDIVELVPRGCRQPAQRLWVDRETGVILRTEQYRFDGSLAALTLFTAFEPAESLPPELFRLNLPKEVRVTTGFDAAARLEDLAEASGIAVRMPTELPPGFVFDGASVNRTDKENIVHLRFTDGLSVISLFEQPAQPFTRYRLKGAKAVALKSGRGWLHEECGGYVLNWTSGGINFTLVGEVAAEVLIRLADSIPPGPGPLAYVRSAFVRLFSR